MQRHEVYINFQFVVLIAGISRRRRRRRRGSLTERGELLVLLLCWPACATQTPAMAKMTSAAPNAILRVVDSRFVELSSEQLSPLPNTMSNNFFKLRAAKVFIGVWAQETLYQCEGRRTNSGSTYGASLMIRPEITSARENVQRRESSWRMHLDLDFAPVAVSGLVARLVA